MVNVTYPGVYVDEVSSGVRPLEVASTSTPAFVGVTEMGPEDATRVTSWTEFQRVFGGFISDSFLAQSVFAYFNNGGRQCYILRVVRSDAATASVTVANRAATPVAGIRFAAKSKGSWANYLVLQIEDASADPGNGFKVSVRRQAEAEVIPQNFADTPALETFDNLSCDPASVRFVEAVLARESGLVTARMLDSNKVQKGLYRGGKDPVLPLGDNRSFQINLDGDGFQPVTLPAAAAQADLAGVAQALQTAVKALTKKKASTEKEAFDDFTCAVETVAAAGGSSRLVLRSGTEKAGSSVRIAPALDHDATAQLKLRVSDSVFEDGAAVQRPARATTVQLGDAQKDDIVKDVVPGDDGAADLLPASFGEAFRKLDTVADASLLAVPGEASTEVMNLGTAYCAGRPLKDMFFIGETGRDDQSAAAAAGFRDNLTASSYGALYYPWVKAIDPAGRSREPVLLPPSGFVAGVYARIDAARGVWKAPAGTEATLLGVVGLGREPSDAEHGNLNAKGTCVLRRFPATGMVVFGARTIAGPAEVEWKYIPVRRTAMMLRVSIYNGIQWAVFEPNDEPLWSQLRLNIGSFMTTLFRRGAFQGSSTSEAFYVKCDGDTTTQADIDLGIVNVEVGFAPVKPAEFVVVRISQKAGQASS
ncbi:phage tail sheath subtilisin-like domain-containing protein [Arthrobacter sp. I2-34]|uniref:Phage tail sheath subtilisin-like domain-containing protein n=1 Tax=Arthrobacter hankyongi TaxID=2904801 RepID=A0ABS9L702_9MICC|nr:phage tail sheath subtilisin-like domain-containing protein [Arthrobacter hankyongi]MCG2622434.1 phage tail sheath subtilisin-like domain-containing protein [Arthrobacter hankyongi]